MLFKECLIHCKCEYQNNIPSTINQSTFKSFIQFYLTMVILFTLSSIIYLNLDNIKYTLRKRFNINRIDELEPLININ